MAAIASNLKKLNLRNFRGRVAIITGGSRGIGRECALALASQGCSIVVAAKPTKPQPTLPGTIYTVAEEVRSCGAEALPFKCNLLEPNDIQACVDATMETFGRVDCALTRYPLKFDYLHYVPFISSGQWASSLPLSRLIKYQS